LELVGYSQEELRNLSYLDFTPKGWEETDKTISNQVLERGYTDIFEKEILRKDGHRIPVSIRASAMKDSNDKIIGSWVIIRDISEYKGTLRKLQHSQNMLQQTSRMSRVGGWELNVETNMFSLTEETFQILSVPRSYQTSVKNIAKLLDRESELQIYKSVKQVLSGKGGSTTELKLMGFSPERWIRVSAQLAYEEKGQSYAYGAVQDISDFKQQQRSLETARDTYQKMAFHDPLTSLPNRLLLEDRFQQISNQARRDKKMVALMIIDLDEFKSVNDKHGHPAGDALLKTIAERLSNSIRSSDTVARLGGDEFVVIARLEDKHQATSLAKKILENIKKPIPWSSISLLAKSSLGIATSTTHDDTFESLYAAADHALYHVKEHGKGKFTFSEDVDQA
jgi:diguanylate cyclase (GGDEF)-like protein/PAS domain S-box-containing protein